MSHFKAVGWFIPSLELLSMDRKLLIGSYFTMEYSTESAALFNPSIVLHPNQDNTPNGCLRVVLSLRATGEGHLSSIVFRQGVLNSSGHIAFDPNPPHAFMVEPTIDPIHSKRDFISKLNAIRQYKSWALSIFDDLPDPFSQTQLLTMVGRLKQTDDTPQAFATVADDILWVLRANYQLRFPEDANPGEIVVFPATEHESRGMEDLRLVRFADDNDGVHYYGTYIAFDGTQLLPMLLETTDFHTFNMATLGGKYAANKGLTLFPRKVCGQYMMIARHDGESLYLLRSDNLYTWNESIQLQRPTESWEFVQIDNCGLPLETKVGWILLTHGVGPVRQYVIGAMLLDLDDPSRVIGRLTKPLLVPMAGEREGYVPNVVYSCGSLIHGNLLVIPYALSDSCTTFATVSVREITDSMLEHGP